MARGLYLSNRRTPLPRGPAHKIRVEYRPSGLHVLLDHIWSNPDLQTAWTTNAEIREILFQPLG